MTIGDVLHRSESDGNFLSGDRSECITFTDVLEDGFVAPVWSEGLKQDAIEGAEVLGLAPRPLAAEVRLYAAFSRAVQV